MILLLCVRDVRLVPVEVKRTPTACPQKFAVVNPGHLTRMRADPMSSPLPIPADPKAIPTSYFLLPAPFIFAPFPKSITPFSLTCLTVMLAPEILFRSVTKGNPSEMLKNKPRKSPTLLGSDSVTLI
jgi:hypothetical protein